MNILYFKPNLMSEANMLTIVYVLHVCFIILALCYHLYGQRGGVGNKANVQLCDAYTRIRVNV